MRVMIILLAIVALTAALLWAVYHTALGTVVGGLVSDGFRAWLHAGSPDRGAEAGYDREFIVLAIGCAAAATLVVWLVDRGVRRYRGPSS